MDTIKVYVGSSGTSHSGMPLGDLGPVEFEGEKVATVTTLEGDETRWTTQVLYKTTDGRYVVYVQEKTQWVGELSHYKLIEVSLEDLGVGGRFEQLGRKGGLGRPMTLDEALETSGDEK